jgi:2-polyprenyl-3-methyl-5-hydroxy-6-metoxy-1,4-benzoquinol methylase
MRRWIRSAELSRDEAHTQSERWEYYSHGLRRTFDVEVKIGKPFDVLRVKGADLGEVRRYSAFLAETAARLYREPLVDLTQCSACEASLSDAPVALRVFGVSYLRCATCRHVMVGRQPPLERLQTVFAESTEHSSAYLDRDAIAARISEIVDPKIDWCLDHYHRRFGGLPSRIIDVGAGGGHFLEGAAARGLVGEGFEQSRASRVFAKDAFGITLRDDDFLSAAVAPADLVTFWGLLEYVPQPRVFLRAARRVLSNRGLLVVEVPRVDALGTLMQAREGAIVARHMDPTSHVNGFSDASLCTALVEEGFAPAAAWYFGMDAWEATMQAAFTIDDAGVFAKLASWIAALQSAADRGRQCDDIVMAAVPLETSLP